MFKALVLLLFLGCCTLFAKEQRNSQHFIHLKIDERLSDTYITNVVKDSDGFIWIGTQDGLNRYDGHEVISYNTLDEADPILSSNHITDMVEDHNKNLWMATTQGITRLNLKTYQFHRYRVLSPDKKISTYVREMLVTQNGDVWASTSHGLYLLQEDQFIPRYLDLISTTGPTIDIVTIVEDNEGYLWAARDNAEVFRLDTKRHEMKSLENIFPKQAVMDDVETIIVDKQGRLWMGNNSAQIGVIDTSNQKINIINLPEHKEKVQVIALEQDTQGDIWIATRGQGLYIYQEETQQFRHMYHSIHFDKSITYDFISNLFVDDKGIVWLSTNAGVNFHNPRSKQFSQLFSDQDNPSSIRNNIVWSVYKRNDQSLWVAHDHGIDVLDAKNNKILSLQPEANNSNSLSNARVWDIRTIDTDSLWFSTTKGLDRYYPETHQFEHYYYNKNNNNSLPHDVVYQVLFDHKQQMWVATYGGLARFRKETNDFVRIPEFRSVLITNIIETTPGILWIASKRSGLYRYDTATSGVKQFVHEPGNSNSLSNTASYSLAFDGRYVWVATDGGLNAIDSKTLNIHTRIRVSEGLPSNSMYRLELDNNNGLWMSTTRGLTLLNLSTRKMINFTEKDGIQEDDFNESSSYYDKAREKMYFGGVNGISIFDPKIPLRTQRQFKPRVTGFLLFNASIKPGPNSLLQRPVHHASEIILNYNQNTFAFKFSNMDILNKYQHRYSYQLKGLEKRWLQTIMNSPIAFFSSVPPGEYQLIVKSSTDNSSWSKESKLINIVIHPPIWATWWAYLSYVTISCIILVTFFYQKLKIKSAEDKRQMAESANEAKSNFLAMMSHEIRTPINGVIGAVSLLSESPLSIEQSNFAKTIKISGENLLYIVNDILDLSKIEAGKLSLENHSFSLSLCIQNSLDLFASELDKKQIELLFIADNNIPSEVISDSTRLRQVIVNLVGNAIKFTESGNISVILTLIAKENNLAKIRFGIKDSGSGIPLEKQKQIFEAFQQASDSIARTHGGTGLGLTISQRLISVLGGQIKVDSQLGKGTEFSFILDMKTPENTPSINYINQLNALDKKLILFIGCDLYQIMLIKNLEISSNVKLIFAESEDESLLPIQSNQTPDAIVLNYSFLDSSIIRLAEKIRRDKNGHLIPVAILATPGTKNKFSEQFSRLFNTHIFKPIRLKTLAARLSDLLNEVSAPKKLMHTELSEVFAKSAPLSILVAEDNAVNQKIILHTLRKLGYNPDIVSNGHEALEAFKKKHYDLLLTDVQMPIICGITVAKTIRKNISPEKLSIVLLSADVLSDFSPLLNKNIIQGVLFKPLQLNELKSSLKNIYRILT